MEKHEVVAQKIVQLVIDEMEEEGKGNLTTIYTIRFLEKVIEDLKKNALLQPAKNYFESKECDTNGC